MEHPRLVDLIRLAVAQARAPEPPLGDRDGSIPVSHYTDPARLERERAALFQRLPIPIVHASEIAAPGACAVRDLAGVSLLIVRGADGVVRGFRNACRHRGTRLAREDCQGKAFVCPYHGWVYALDGALRHVPHPQAFPNLDLAAHSLSAVRVEERHGLVWVALDPSAPDVATHLGALDEDDVSDVTTAGLPLRELATFGYVLFPCTVFIAHPDWISHVVVQPLGTSRFLWQHTMLLPDRPSTDAESAHFDRSFALIEENVFMREDLFAVAEMQAGIETGAISHVTFGRLEWPALWLHDGIRELLGE